MIQTDDLDRLPPPPAIDSLKPTTKTQPQITQPSSHASSTFKPAAQQARYPLTSPQTQLENDKLKEAQKNIAELIQRKYVIIRAFINKVIAPKNIHCLIDFSKISHDTIVGNETLNKDLLKRYSETFNKVFGIKSKITKSTPDDKIKSSYIIKFIRMCLESIGYVMVRKIINKKIKSSKSTEVKTIKTSYYTITLKPSMTFRK